MSGVEEVTPLLSYFSTRETFLDADIGESFRSTQNELSVIAGANTFLPTGRYINMALLYLYRKAALEAKQFVSPSKLEKIAIEKEGVLLSVGRLLDDMNFQETAELSGLDLGSLGGKGQPSYY